MENFANINGLCGLAEGDENGATLIWSQADPSREARENLDYGNDFFDLADGGVAHSFDDAVAWVLELETEPEDLELMVLWDWPEDIEDILGIDDEPRCGLITVKKLSDIPKTFAEFVEIWGDYMVAPDLNPEQLKKALEINPEVRQISDY